MDNHRPYRDAIVITDGDFQNRQLLADVLRQNGIGFEDYDLIALAGGVYRADHEAIARSVRIFLTHHHVCNKHVVIVLFPANILLEPATQRQDAQTLQELLNNRELGNVQIIEVAAKDTHHDPTDRKTQA
jgi:hypothetical protein